MMFVVMSSLRLILRYVLCVMVNVGVGKCVICCISGVMVLFR